jgi:hypothetical protein
MLAGQLLVTANCKDGKFTGSAGSKKGEEDLKKKPTPTDCTPDGITQAKLLTPTVQNNIAEQTLEYELSVTNCEGVAQTIKSNFIYFDLDVLILSRVSDEVSFVVWNATRSKKFAEGSLQNINGSDLFGKTGPLFNHNKTDQAVQFDTEEKSLILKLTMRKWSMAPIAMQSTPPADPYVTAFTSDSYLRYGEAQPVKTSVDIKP